MNIDLHKDPIPNDLNQSGSSWTETGSVRVPVTLSWEQIRYEVPVKVSKFPKKTVQKVILDGVSGLVKPGQLLAIVGSTGAGKSSLLDVLAQRKKEKFISGKVLINGRKPDKFFKRLSGYVTQDDALPGFFTVRETLQFYADLQLPSTVPAMERQRRVQEVLDVLGLTKVADSRVGTQFRRGISGGEKKRLSIGCQLITDPGLLFLDEPTTGLDAFNSLSVIETMNRLCAKGRTIICTIHQPRSTIYELFDQLMVLSQGKTVYFGPANTAVDFFSAQGFECGKFINPADFFIDVTIMNEKALLPAASKRESDPLLDSKLEAGELVNLPERYKVSPAYAQLKNEIQESKSADAQYPTTGRLTEFASGWFRQTRALSVRSAKNLSRNPLVTYAQLGQTIFIALLVGSIYFQIGDDQGSIQDRVGALFFIMTNQAFAMIASLNLLLEERDLFNRERASGTYRTSAYFVSKTMIEAPIFLLFPIVFGTIAYWMVGFQPNGACFGVFLAALITFAATAGSLFLAIGAFAPNVVIAQIMSPLIIVLFMLFGGFYINVNNIPVWYEWLYYISFFNYGFEILCYNEFQGWGNESLQFTCSNTSSVCIKTGSAELAILGYSEVTGETIGYDFAILWGMVIGYRLLGYVFLRFLNKEKR